MRWKGRRQSTNVEDRRSGSRGGGGRRVAVGGGGAIIIVIIALLLGADMGDVMQLLDGGGGPAPGEVQRDQNPAAPAADDELKQFVSVVLADTEDVWTQLFRDMGREYKKPKLVLFADRVESACGFQSAAVGPFYCPADHNVYIDLSFYQDLKKRHRSPGDFAQAYVIAHEVGHHVQNLLGISTKVHKLKRQVSKEQSNDLSVRLELQADFFAGVWAHHAHRAKQILEKGDIEEAMTAASAIGDDRLQMEARGYVVPESFTHGTSQQRVRWFKKGLLSGKISEGDTFSAKQL